MSEESATILFLNEPERIADWDEDIRKSPQLFSPRTYVIRLLHVIFNEENPSDVSMGIVQSYAKEYPEFIPEIKERFPDLVLD